ncbi:MAG: peptidoglycan DD-metalloendopeptidase family protein [Actinobacteria bacterium]|nr:peptidoglycan DD-metalloendopeptidase family protein [Actinomycetota bacterium]
MSLMLMQVTPAAASGESAALDKARQQLSEIRKQLQVDRAKAADIKKDVDALDSQIFALDRQIRTGEHDVSALESEIRTAQAKIGELEAAYGSAANASRTRARKLYVQGPMEAVSQLMNAKSLIEFVRLQVFLEVASNADGKTMIDASRLKADLVDRKADLDHIRTDLRAQKEWLVQRRQLVAQAEQDKALALASVQNDIDREEANIKKLEQESKRLTSTLRHSSAISRSTGAVSHSGFIWPLHGQITSPYGPRHGGFHPGIDIDGNTGDPIVAAKAGTIAQISCGSGYGLCTIIDHGGGVSTLYAHQSRQAISSGSVQQGQVIGYVGCTGYCTGSHLHFEVRVNGSPENPMNYLP